MAPESPYSLYLHIPFCRHKCSYCDFNTYAGLDNLIGDYTSSLAREIRLQGESAGLRIPVHTIFFGGGTPSLLSAPQLETIIEALETSFELHPQSEITLEANPGTLSLAKLNDFRAAGINRLSLGMQSAVPQELALLERQHTPIDVPRAVSWARQAGFEDLNLDLIFGLPHQSLQAWQRSLDLALQLQPSHFSLYALTLEHGTPLRHWVDRGLVPLPDPDLGADMYLWAQERLARAGYGQYEISSWAARAETGGSGWRECRHNLQYWRNAPYLGLGAGAHGFARGVRTANVLGPMAYIRRIQAGKGEVFPLTPATVEVTDIDRRTEMQETVMMGLRLTVEGVSAPAFERRFGEPLGEVFEGEIDDLITDGLLEWSQGEVLRLTGRGRLLGNRVFERFV
jgi:oxygen-independent coproporphyrinogen-3 oxidase